MDVLVSNEFLNCLLISLTLSIIIMALIQKFKSLSFIKTNNQIFILNSILSFVIGIPFCITFYKLDLIYSIWVSILSFIGAPSIYILLKNQNIINYTPTRLDEKYTEIKKDE